MTHYAPHRIAVVFALGALGLAPRAVVAQAVLIAPTAVVIHAKSPSAALTLVNTGDRAAEVSISTSFGVPVTDSVGQMHLALDSMPSDTVPSATSFVHIYPSRFVLAPGERRVVRVVAAPTTSITDREYWARLVVTSRVAKSPPAITDTSRMRGDGTGDAHDTPQVALDLEVRSILAVFYRPAGVTTSVVMDPIRTRLIDGAIESRVALTREGTAAFVGSVHAILRDSGGVVRASTQLPLGVYYVLDPALRLTIGTIPSGTYQLELVAMTKRPDVPTVSLISGLTVRRFTTVIIP